MKTTGASLLAVLGAASCAWAQPQTQGDISYTLTGAVAYQNGGSWSNAPTIGPAGNQVALSGPSQGVLFRIRVSMSIDPGPASLQTGGFVGGPLTWNPSIQAGSSGLGSNAGFWNGDLNLIGTGGQPAGTWSEGTAWHVSVRTRLLIATAGNTGTATPPGNGRTNIQPAQFNADAEGINHGNNYVVFQGMWIPTVLDPSLITFNISLGSLGLLSSVGAADSQYDNGYTLPVALRVNTVFGGPVLVGIPGPGGLALLGLGGLAAARRRRA